MDFVVKYLKALTEAHIKEYDKMFPNLEYPEFTAKYGNKYIKIIRTRGQQLVHCFLDFDGNIYKAASWKIPAKGIRGNVNNETYPLMGGDYYKS
jgi:hypothetical protein